MKWVFIRRSGVVGPLAALAIVAGCTRVSDTQRFTPNPDTVEITATIPEAGGEAPPDVAIRLCWSDLLVPSSVNELDAVVGSGSLLTDVALNFELRPWTAEDGAQLGPDAVEPWCGGSVLTITPKEALTAGVQYRLRLADVAIGWKGEHADVEAPGWVREGREGVPGYYLEFDVVEDERPGLNPGPEDDEVEAVTLSSLFEASGVFDPERALCSCHLDPEDDASTLLDLRTVDAAYEGLLFESRLRETGYPMVTPRRPSESFLLQKVLRDDGEALAGVHGDAMPLGDMALPYGDYVMLARWIEDGAMR